MDLRGGSLIGHVPSLDMFWKSTSSRHFIKADLRHHMLVVIPKLDTGEYVL